MKNKQLFSGILVLLVCLSCSCKKDKKPEYVDMIFEIPFSITPIKDTIAVGDTLWLEANFPDTIKEHKSGKYYRITPNNLDFQTTIGFYKLTLPNRSIAVQPGFAQAFTILNQKGAIKDLQETYGDLQYIYSNNSYQLRIGIIPKYSGVAAISFFSKWLGGTGLSKEADISFIDLGQTEDGAKRKPILEEIYHVINNGDTNFDLLQKYCDAISVREPLESAVYFEQKAMYTFIVK